MTSAVNRATQLFSGKKVLIFGLGLLGGAVGDARFFDGLGAKVTVTDHKSKTELATSLQALSNTTVTFHLGEHTQDDIWDTDYIIRNPGVPMDHPLLVLAKKFRKPILMRSSLFVELSQIPVIGITGTRGKTTTTTMIHQLATELSDKKVFLAGNISGMSDLELLSQIDDPDNSLAVMELSSWQLQGFAESKISPHIAVITNLFPDHLNHYPSLETYYQDKHHIILHQNARDHAVLNSDQPEFQAWAKTLDSQVHWFSQTKLPQNLNLTLRGDHNRANAAAALEVAKLLNLDIEKSTHLLNHFTGVDYRLQTISNKNGIEYINDTTATTPEAVIAALNSLPQAPIIICGGADKQLPLEALIKALNQKTKKIILLTGSGTDKIINHIRSELILGQVDSMSQAVSLAQSVATPGDSILLSPGFASFGLFVNEFDRGDQFNQCVLHSA